MDGRSASFVTYLSTAVEPSSLKVIVSVVIAEVVRVMSGSALKFCCCSVSWFFEMC